MIKTSVRLALAATVLALGSAAIADHHDPIHERHELMESVRDAAKPVGLMLRGETDYDADVVMESLELWRSVGTKFGDLFPEGSETGQGTEAAPAIWEDREGFNDALAQWREATDKAIAADPQTLEAARPIIGPVFNTCKNCHDSYRIEED